ncbi:hypothetical protein Pogu_1972 [Pyrobaculum oguniense TE7]|uniref:Uncharacterized protein n=1 Tax=Pyrobaculum oguniense (strain DSM 13380 / JCM 10595 / TE7) TaxID=698757 RepID=H6QCN1_PYROT|nr:hypothetical protein Pogu_1972 [Pyrobaculum oguniense TE7]
MGFRILLNADSVLAVSVATALAVSSEVNLVLLAVQVANLAGGAAVFGSARQLRAGYAAVLRSISEPAAGAEILLIASALYTALMALPQLLFVHFGWLGCAAVLAVLLAGLVGYVKAYIAGAGRSMKNNVEYFRIAYILFALFILVLPTIAALWLMTKGLGETKRKLSHAYVDSRQARHGSSPNRHAKTPSPYPTA